ncbi:MAG: hypothetical protein H6766_04915 [Candidatus Peribacteria bacterium]|nr:MAG: hypothetical protein H6766_04915 [Candidatus Peribacteria bacterium]
MIKMLKNITKKGEINAISAIKALDTYANVYTPKITDNHPDVTSFVDDFLSHGLASYEPMAGAGKKISKKEHKNLEKFAQAYIYGSLSKQVKGENGKRVNTREFYASDDYRTVVVDGYFNMLRMGKNNMSQIARNIKTSNNMEEIEDTDTPSEEEKKRLSTTYEDVMNMTPEEVESLINTDLSYQLA